MAPQSPSFLEQPIGDSDLVPHLDDAKPFDSTFVLLHWIKSCRNGMGLSEHNINNLLQKVLFHKSFHLNQVKVKSATNCENYDAKMYQREDGWLKYVV
jgi:hypothetical protein